VQKKSTNKRANQRRKTTSTTVVVHKQNKQSKPKKKGNVNKSKTMHPCNIAMINPFLPQVNGIRSPDEYGWPTGTGVTRNDATLGSDANGFLAQIFTPVQSYYRYAPANTTAGTVTWAGGTYSNTSQLSALQSVATLYRTVAWGIRITTESSLTATSGHIWVAHIPFDVSGALPYFEAPTTENQYASCVLSEKFSLVELAERPLIVPARAIDDGIYRFRTPNTNDEKASTTAAVESSNGWANIAIFVAGAPASTGIINVEVIHHVEYIQAPNAFFDFIDTQPSPYDLQAMITNTQANSLKPIAVIETSVDTMEKAAAAVNSTVNSAARLGSALYRVYDFGSKLYQSTGWARATGNAPRALRM
jgi:hypothetical protein